MELRREPGAFARVGHRGASALAPENTLPALELAVQLGCDMLEFDVLDVRDGTLVLAHSDRLVASPPLTLDETLAYCAERFPHVALQLDLKRRGIESRVVDALRRHRMLERAWISGFDAPALRRVAELETSLPRSYTLPRSRFGVSQRPALVRRIPGLLERARATALTLHHSLASPAVIERTHELGAAVYAWTVNDPALAARLVGAGADGIITDDPRIFKTLT